MEDLFQSIMSHHTAKLAEKINQHKEQILNDRLKQLGIKIDILKEQDRRFTKLRRVMYQDSTKETWYYDDGTKDGLRVVTFELISPPFDMNAKEISIGLNLKHY